MNEKVIKFWKISENGVKLPYGDFSNFAQYPFTVKGVNYATSEHYFQSKKFLDENIAKQIRDCKTPKEAAEMGRRRDLPLREDWEQVKDETMREAIYYKFITYPYLVNLLKSTEDAYIEEASLPDSYWGTGRDGTGKNMLGKLLVELRNTLMFGVEKTLRGSPPNEGAIVYWEIISGERKNLRLATAEELEEILKVYYSVVDKK